MPLSKIDLATSVVQLIAVGGVSKIAKEVIANNTGDPETALQNLQYVAGVTVIGAVAAKSASDHIDEQVKKSVAIWRKFRSKDEDPETTES